MHPIINYIRQALQDQANLAQAPAMQAYMKSEMPYRGVKSAVQKQIQSAALKAYPVEGFADYISVIDTLWDAEYREERYAAIGVARRVKKFQTLEALPIYRMMIETGAWWDYVDSIAADLIGAILQRYPYEMKPELRAWIDDDHLWIRRSALLAQLRFKAETDERMLFEFCEKRLDESSFWIRKAVGWALREYSKTAPDAVRAFFQRYQERMSGVTKREVVKYI